eukprot:jgi/Mesen1/9/ME1041005C03906
MGVLMGLLFGALEQPLHAEEMTTRQILVHGARTMGSRSWHMGKTFAVMGAIFSGAECVVEKVTHCKHLSAREGGLSDTRAQTLGA